MESEGCGQELRDGARYCDRCGTGTDGETKLEPTPEEPLYGWNLWGRSIRFVILAVVGSTLFVVSILSEFYELAILSFILAIVGWALVWYLMTHHG